MTSYAGKLRRKGWIQDQIEAALLAANDERCRPPLSAAEVWKIAASVSGYPAGGSDVLERAWATVQAVGHASGYDGFLALCAALQEARHGQSIALPLKRIGELMEVHFTQIARWRKRAVNDGRLIPTQQYIAHERAAGYRFIPVGAEYGSSSGYVN